ncbi:hypothetical protein Tsubulata_048304 [Turnera subulata]|uniref:Uncharacterized protein n=1 Tax=Turnera subulata TaxID=218843 RepID=A0A9Q0J1V2_9ROSI|nr:hypothetical protein Tsubulata_048304 [Turnera subulata]
MTVLLNGKNATAGAPRVVLPRRDNRSGIPAAGGYPMTPSTGAEGAGPVPGGKKKKKKKALGEVAGGTAAECAAVCCCCPCALMDLLVLAVVKVPAGLCKKAKRRRRQMRKKKRRQHQPLLAEEPTSSVGGVSREDLEREVREFVENWKKKGSGGGDDEDGDDKESEDETLNLEREMWAQFCATGFWRSPSQREIA